MNESAGSATNLVTKRRTALIDIIDVRLKLVGVEINQCSVTSVPDSDTSPNNVQADIKSIQENTPNGQTRNNEICKITVNMDHNVNTTDATVNAQVGVGGKMLSCRVLLDSGADFTCVRNDALLKMKESGVNLTLEPPSDPEFIGVAANGGCLTVVGNINLDLEFNLKSGEKVLVNWTFVVLDNLNHEFIIGMDVLRQIGFGVGRDSLWIGDKKTGTICSLKQANQETLYLRCQKTLGNETWCLYGVDEPIKKRLTSIADSDWSMNRAGGSKNISRISREQKCEMQALFLVNFPCGEEIPQRIARSCSISLPPTLRNAHELSISNIKRTKFVSDENLEAIVGRSSFNDNDKDKLRRILKKHRKIFSTGDTDVGEYKGKKAVLKFKPGRTDPVYVPVRRVPMELRSWLKKRLDEMENCGIIGKCDGSSYNSPLFLVKKASGKWREVNDFRCLNDRLEDNHYPLPHLRDLLDELHGSKFFSSIDLRSGYFNMVLDEESRLCTAFNANGQTYIYKRLPQGIKVAPMIFQREMIKVVGDLLKKSCLVFMDDLLAYDKTVEDALQTIDKVLQRFGEAGFLLNGEKCQFGVITIRYLGFQISEHGWVPTKDKVKSITDFPLPTTVTELKSFIGGINFFSSSIPCLHGLLKPLHALAGNRKVEFKLTEEAIKAFDLAKKALAKATTCAFYSHDPDDTLFLTTDASDQGWGCMLSQYQNSKSCEVPLAFGSGAFGGSQLNWPIYEKELYSFVSSLKLTQVYVFGRNFTWRTDNKALSHFYDVSVVKNTATKITPKVTRWLDFIGDFSFSVEHFPGTNPVMRMADALSRQKFGNITAIKGTNQWFNVWMTSGISEPDLVLAQENDYDLLNLTGPYSNLNRPEIKLDKHRGFRICIWRGGEQLIIIPEALVDQFLEYIHGLNHRGINQMLNMIYGQFYVCDVKERVKNFVRGCLKCRKIKPGKRSLNEPVRQSVAFAPWSHVHMDLSGPFPRSWQGNRYILAVICNLTRWCVLRAIPSKHAESVAVGLRSVFCEYGPCTSLLSDNGKEFANRDLRTLLNSMGVNLQHSTPYRPQSNGIVERLNQKIKSLLKLHDAEDLTWEDGLGEIQLAINLEFNRCIGTSPYQAFHGWTLENLSFIKPEEQSEIGNNEDSKMWIHNHRLKMTRALADQVMDDYRKKEQRYFKACKDYDECDSNRRSSEIGVGSTVLIHTPQPVGVCGKLYSAWKGYYKILKKFPDNPNVYLVCHESDQKRQKLVHRNLIRVVENVDATKETLRDQQSLGTQPVGASSPILKNKEENHGEDVVEETAKEMKKTTRSGRQY